KISRAFVDGSPTGGLTRASVLDNITLYWLTHTATSAARMYWESARSAAAGAGHPPPEVSLPVAFTGFPCSTLPAPRRRGEKGYRNLIYFNEVDRGGHFAAWEEPELFSQELRAAFRSTRSLERSAPPQRRAAMAAEVQETTSGQPVFSPFRVDVPEETIADLR